MKFLRQAYSLSVEKILLEKIHNYRLIDFIVLYIVMYMYVHISFPLFFHITFTNILIPMRRTYDNQSGVKIHLL